MLIVDDDDAIAELYARIFMKEGFQVFIARDGRAAIDKFSKKKPHIVLLDIMMPNVDGYKVLTEIRKKHDSYVPVIMMTNLDMQHFTENQSIDNIDGYILKSEYTPLEVVKKAREVLNV